MCVCVLACGYEWSRVVMDHCVVVISGTSGLSAPYLQLSSAHSQPNKASCAPTSDLEGRNLSFDGSTVLPRCKVVLPSCSTARNGRQRSTCRQPAEYLQEFSL